MENGQHHSSETILPSLSYRRKEWTDLRKWKKKALTQPSGKTGHSRYRTMPEVTVKKQYTYDGLHIEELSWNASIWPAYRCNSA